MTHDMLVGMLNLLTRTLEHSRSVYSCAQVCCTAVDVFSKPLAEKWLANVF